MFENWPCYHTQLDTFTPAGRTVGIVGCAVGAPFAVLIAEQLFASGCSLLLSLTSAGQIMAAGAYTLFRTNSRHAIYVCSWHARASYVAVRVLHASHTAQAIAS